MKHTCDICGKTKEIESDTAMPDGWDKVQIGYIKYDACGDCIQHLYKVVNKMRYDK